LTECDLYDRLAAMSVYQNSIQLETCADRLFRRMQEEHPAALKRVLGQRMLIRLACRQPATTIWLDGRRRPLQLTFGEVRQRPHLDIALASSTLHLILLGDLSLQKAFASGNVQVAGALWRLPALAELFDQAQTLYPAILREMDLIA